MSRFDTHMSALGSHSRVTPESPRGGIERSEQLEANGDACSRSEATPKAGIGKVAWPLSATRRSLYKLATAVGSSQAASPKSSTRRNIPTAVALPEGFLSSEDDDNTRISVSLDLSAGTHVVLWSAHVYEKSVPTGVQGNVALYPGSCLLYTYPTIQWDASAALPDVEVPRSAQLLLSHILLWLASAEGCSAFDLPDLVGAYPIHALTVCNTPAAITLTMQILHARPALLKQVHAHHGGPHSTARCPYGGESVLHIACVNRREGVLLDMIHCAADNLSPDEVRALFCSQANGFFFEAPPMRLCAAPVARINVHIVSIMVGGSL